jgi:hypothetical protein
MALTLTQVPPDSTGDKLDMRSLVRGADTLLQQGVYFPALPTYLALSAAITPAANKYHIIVRNDAASAQSLYLLGLRYFSGVAAVTGVINEFRWQRQTYGTPSGGAAITADPNNSADPALANVTIYGGATGGVGADGTVRRLVNISSEEHTATVADVDRLREDGNLLLPAGPWSRPMVLRPGEAAAIKQIGSGAVGAFRWELEFAIEPD